MSAFHKSRLCREFITLLSCVAANWPPKQPFATQKGMPALPPQADIERIKLDVRYGPIAIYAKFVPTFLHGPANWNCLTEITVRNLDFARGQGSNCKIANRTPEEGYMDAERPFL